MGVNKKATFADGYGGWVIDLGDGTCRIANDILLGNTLKYGDRVDLFYNPTDPFERPRIGYRVYADGEEPTGRNCGLEWKPSPDELQKYQEKKAREREQELKLTEELHELRMAVLKAERKLLIAAEAELKYQGLVDWAAKNGLAIPSDLHDSRPVSKTEEERRQDKLNLMAYVRKYYSDIEITEEEIERAKEVV